MCTGQAGVEYEIVWKGPWKNTWQTAGEIGNDQLVADYVAAKKKKGVREQQKKRAARNLTCHKKKKRPKRME